MTARVILAGCGNMGYAMLAGWLKGRRLQPDHVAVVEPNEALRARAAALGATCVAAPDDLPEAFSPDLVVLAVKPQVMREVAPSYRRYGRDGAAFLSIAAGTRIAVFEEMLGGDAAIARCMPNTPAAIGKGMMVTTFNPNVTETVKALIADLLSASGAVTTVENEGLMDAVTAVSGSGPAYVFHFIECLTAAGESAGLPPDIAKLLAMQTVYGAANLAAESAEAPARLREQVTSPNGTTAAALRVLMGGDRLKVLVEEAVEAARQRSVELG